MHQANAHQGQAAAWPPEPKEKACPAATPDRPHAHKRHTPATVPPDAPSCKCFASVQAQFALLGYELRTHTTTPGLVHQIRDDDVPKPSKASGRTTFIVGHWTGSRHVASWHGVISLLSGLQELELGA